MKFVLQTKTYYLYMKLIYLQNNALNNEKRHFSDAQIKEKVIVFQSIICMYFKSVALVKKRCNSLKISYNRL